MMKTANPITIMNNFQEESPHENQNCYKNLY